VNDGAPDPARERQHPRVTWWGVAILFTGLLAAEVVYFLAPDDEADAAAQVTHAKLYEHNVELVGGKAALFAGRFNEWFASLWHGRSLAYTIAVVTVVVGAACLMAGRLLSPPPER